MLALSLKDNTGIHGNQLFLRYRFLLTSTKKSLAELRRQNWEQELQSYMVQLHELRNAKSKMYSEYDIYGMVELDKSFFLRIFLTMRKKIRSNVDKGSQKKSCEKAYPPGHII